jgi:YD repeat-containing protein
MAGPHMIELRAAHHEPQELRATRGADVFSYLYDPAGNVTKRTYPDSTAVNYGYDDDGRLSSTSSGGTTCSASRFLDTFCTK